MDKDGPSFQWFQEAVVCITIYPITVLEVNNEKGTQSQLTWLLPENVESTPKRHLGVLDLALLSSSHLWKTADNLQMTVQLPLRLGVVIWLVFRSEWEQWSLPHQHGTFTKSGGLLEMAETTFRWFLQSLEKVSLTSWSVTEIQAVSEYYRHFFFTARTYIAPTTTTQQGIIKRNLPTLPTTWRTTGVLISIYRNIQGHRRVRDNLSVTYRKRIFSFLFNNFTPFLYWGKLKRHLCKNCL